MTALPLGWDLHQQKRWPEQRLRLLDAADFVATLNSPFPLPLVTYFTLAQDSKLFEVKISRSISAFVAGIGKSQVLLRSRGFHVASAKPLASCLPKGGQCISVTSSLRSDGVSEAP